MKYLAILKDSFREALDSKVLYVMVALSLLAALFIATVSFVPQPADKLMADLVRGYVQGIPDPERQQKAAEERAQEAAQAKDKKKPKAAPAVDFKRFEFKGVEVLKGEPDSPDSEYLVTVRLPVPDPEAAAKLKAAPGAALTALRETVTRLGEQGFVQVSDVRLAGPGNRFVPASKEEPPALYFEVATAPTSATRRLWPHEIHLFFGAVPIHESAPLGFLLYLIASGTLSIGSWVALIVGIIITAFFIPNMLRKGTVDLLLVKPIHRPALLVYKYLGGLTFIFLNTAVAVIGIWLALGLRSGVWANSFLLMIFIITFFFAILYAVSTLFAVLTRSAIVAILVTCGAWFLFFLVGTVYQVFDDRSKLEEDRNFPADQRWSDNAFATTVRAIHFVLPRTSDLNRLGSQLIFSDFLTEQMADAIRLTRTSITWGESLIVSLVFIAVMLGLACWRFATKDY
jgi:ABC-type transport system involved in multi-copper enzyme maturation permease subunit